MLRSTPLSGVCLDANLVVRLTVVPVMGSVQRLWDQWQTDGRELVAPFLFRYEVTNALHRYERAGTLSAEVVRRALAVVLGLPIRLYTEPELHQEAVEWARRFDLPAAYDAHYLALAHRLGTEFWTVDGRLARAVQGKLPWVHLVVP
jgi:predicted nucleic acid-binding protein